MLILKNQDPNRQPNIEEVIFWKINYILHLLIFLMDGKKS